MKITFHTEYDQKALTAMARVLRRTVRLKHSRCTRAFGWVVVILGTLLSLPPGGDGLPFSAKTAVTWLALLAVLAALLWEDRLNGYIAQRRGVPGLKSAAATFTREGYYSVTKLGESRFYYSSILLLAETRDYFVFVFGRSHAQVYAKSGIDGGSVEDFRALMRDVTGKEIMQIR